MNTVEDCPKVQTTCHEYATTKESEVKRQALTKYDNSTQHSFGV